MIFVSHRPARAVSRPPEEVNFMASAADLMTGLLFVFIILVAFLALQKKMEQERSVGEKDPRGAVTKLIGRELSKSIPNIVVDPRSGVITFPESSFFDSGSASLTSRGMASLSVAAKRLEQVLACYVANQRAKADCTGVSARQQIDTIFIEGHTDNLPLSRPGGNLKLSLDRADAVGKSLNRNTRLDQFRNSLGQPIFSYSAYADQRPIDPGNPSSPKNRRVEFRIVLAYQGAGESGVKSGER